VNHCINDIAVIGAKPLFFLDYIGAERLEPKVFREILKGFAKACKAGGCALIGGETAQMPGMYQRGEYDLSDKKSLFAPFPQLARAVSSRGALKGELLLK
jgi:phosphoribosylformylglycinamidine cyclo-ligase